MEQADRPRLAWMDLVLLVFLGWLAVLKPLFEIHKQLTLLAIGLFQIFEGRFLRWVGPSRGRVYSVILKILLGSLLLTYTGGIESSYYLIYYLPVVTAAMYFNAGATLLWTALTSVAYCSFLFPALVEFELTTEGATELAIRNLFFFLAATLVNRFVTESRQQAARYRRLAEELAAANRQLAAAQEEARRSERLAALGQLSAGLAHELRNPLGVIKGSAETLSRKLADANPLAAELANYISAEVNHLNTIVSRFLDFARPSRLALRLEQIPPLIERGIKAAQERWPQSKVEVERQYAAQLPSIPVDTELCEQMFTNLILNAYQAMPEGGKLRVAAMAADCDGRRGVQIEIEDTGPGIPAEIRGQIFNPFFSTKKEGVGLGLSIVSKIVDDHRGWIRLVSDPGKGACFRLFLPAEPS